jgi:hypothetical protein
MQDAQLLSHVDTDLVMRNQLHLVRRDRPLEGKGAHRPRGEGADPRRVRGRGPARALPAPGFRDVLRAAVPGVGRAKRRSLHNAFTAAAKQMPMSTRLGATQGLGMSENADDARSPKLLAA